MRYLCSILSLLPLHCRRFPSDRLFRCSKTQWTKGCSAVDLGTSCIWSHFSGTTTFLFLTLGAMTVTISSSMVAQSTSPLSPATTVVLKNGDQITGIVVSSDPKTVVLATGYAGQITIDASQIQQIQSISQRVSDTAAQSIVPPPTLPAPTVSLQPRVGILGTKLSAGFTGSAQRDQTYSMTLDFFANEHQTAPGVYSSRTLLLLSPSYDEKWKAAPNSANVTQVYNGTLQQLFFADHTKINAFLIANAYHNNSQGVRVDQAYGAGILERIKVKHQASFEFDQDIRFIGDMLYSPGGDISAVGSSLSVAYSKLILPSGDLIALKLGGVPAFNRSDAWKTSGSFDYSHKISKSLSLTFNVVDNYFEIAPKTFNKNYVKTTLGIQYKPAWQGN